MANSKIAKGMNYSSPILNNSDLNDLTIHGFYYCGTQSQAENLQNNPHTSSGFTMLVINRGNSNVNQIIFAQDTVYLRALFSIGWTAWRKINSIAIS